jgi:hypothetical protein
MEHPAHNSMEAFSRRALPPAAMLTLSRHLAVCPMCRDEMTSLALDGKDASTVDWYPAEEVGLHLSSDEIATAAIDATILQADATLHLASCPQCLQEVAQLRTFCPPLVVIQAKKTAASRRIALWPVWAGLAAAGVVLAVTVTHWRHTNPPTQAELPPNAELVASLNDGDGTIGLDAHGQLRTPELLPPQYASLLVEAFTTHHLPLSPTLGAYDNGAEITRGEPSGLARFRILSPLSEKTTAQPEFRWEAAAQAVTYQVEISDERYRLVSRSPLIEQTSWTIAVPLTPGKYTWVVRAATPAGTVQSPGPPQREAHFEVADRNTLAAIDTAARKYPHLHLLLASLYAKAGMRSMAAQEMFALERQNPNSTIARDLASSLVSRSGENQSIPSKTKPAQ